MSAIRDEINRKLENASFNKEQIQEINKILSDVTQKSQKENKQNDFINKIAEAFSQNPKVFIEAFKQDRIIYLYDFGIAFILVTALVILSLKGILGTCESSTILGGIVGYLLGKSK